MTYISNITRSKGDPRVLSSGPSSLAASDQIGRLLGWFSIGLGLIELLAPGRVTRALGMEGNEGLVRAYGVREIGSGVLSLAEEKQLGLWSRVAGDGIDVATLVTAFRENNPRRDNVGLALAMVLGITLLDLASAPSITAYNSHRRGNGRLYPDRSGFPHGIEKTRGAAKGRESLR
ncbi:MAG: hypothetical protein QOF70_940 [Acetobacteraceae bacterium]|nr:hypothetical protein [Acetobacteraceae bacterium]